MLRVPCRDCPPIRPNFLCSELGAQTPADEKSDCYIVNGAHGPGRHELLDAFINKFVLCGSCKNIETDLIITANVCNGKECGELWVSTCATG
jgi:translation initiation factor 5